ncbi:hypothetical protein [Solirhodobacter olei]|uniref:hypothetical protein n=1 Tax=Solirhodobacter olei TaxID=2493082 RepID=UPI0013E3D805|nr:hypothetical protein [Solirhodobacter olei]
MPLAEEHEIHKRRLGRNLGIGLSLMAFVLIVFAVTVVKVAEAPQPGHVAAQFLGAKQ